MAAQVCNVVVPPISPRKIGVPQLVLEGQWGWQMGNTPHPALDLGIKDHVFLQMQLVQELRWSGPVKGFFFLSVTVFSLWNFFSAIGLKY